MRRNNKTIFTILILSGFCFSALAQDEWQAPEKESKNLSIIVFDEEKQQEGKQIYTNSCVSCHGAPSQGNYTPMAPPPGDVSSERFQLQTDGTLFYKIQKGRGAMPSFENSLVENEIWSLIAYIRSFHPNYKQILPDMNGVVIPKLAINIEFDDNIDKLVVKVSDDSGKVQSGVSVTAFIKGMFGNHLLGNSQTNELGIAWIDIDTKIPGDSAGYIDIAVKASKGFGSAKKEERIQAASPTVKISAIEGRHLWSRAKNAPIWMIITFNLIGIGIWGAILYIIIGLRKIKKLQ